MFDGDGWWMMIFPIMGLVFIALMISGMWGFWGRGPRRGGWMGPMGMMGDDHEPGRDRDESAMEVLRRRYASGELSDQEFEDKRRRLEGQVSQTTRGAASPPPTSPPPPGPPSYGQPPLPRSQAGGPPPPPSWRPPAGR